MEETEAQRRSYVSIMPDEIADAILEVKLRVCGGYVHEEIQEKD